MSTERLIFAGFGGQGVMSMGQMIAYAGMIENKHVTWCLLMDLRCVEVLLTVLWL